MADNLIFSIGFDLEKAVNEAGQQWDKKYAKKLEDYMAKRPVRVKLDFEKLEDVKKRLAQLKIEPITPETKAAIKELARELQVLAKALEQVQKYSSRSVGTAEVRGAKVDEIEAKAAAARELARQRAAKAEQAELKLAAAREKSATAANKATTAVNNLTKAYGNQTYYIERLLKKMVAVWSVQQVQNFLTNVREVTAQFELQRVSLGAIIQDTNKASQLFSEIKTFALKSPVSIMDLTKYTKQVAAYGIETKKLFDTTKMLTDISVGLGTDMSRAVLFFGQVYASNYLRASELRQATELGIPLVDKLAKKLEELNGRGYTAAEVMDLISKRAISFELVEQVFKDMTSAGGQFYNIQEKQGNTLFGLWAKLGDAASVMYDQIGNTESVNSGMKTAIGLLTELMRNWKAVAQTAQWVIIPNAALLALYKYSTATQRVEAAQSAAAAATERRKAAVLQLATLNEKATVDEINAAWATLQKAKADEVAAQKATTRMGLLKSGFVSVAKSIGAGLGIGLAIGAVTTLAYKLFEAYENAHRLDSKLDEIDAERVTLASQTVRNFEYLADVAVKAADGSKKQKDALDELRRTYKEMIPVQDLTIEHLRQLREGTNNASEAYKSLTTAIREYISEQQKQKKLSAIEEEYGSTITDKYKKLYSELTKGITINVGGRKIKSWVELQFSPEEFERAMVEFEKRATDKTKSVGQKIKESFAAIGFDLTPDQIKALQQVGKWGEFDDGYFITLNEALEEQAERIDAVHTGYAGFVGDLGKYGAEMSRIADVMENKIYKANGKVLESNSFLRKQMQSNEWIKEWTNSLKTNLSAAGIEIKNEWFNFIKSLNPSDPNTISSINFDAILEALNTDAIREKLGEHYEQTKNYVLAIQKEYQDLVPQNRTVAVLRAKLSSISQATGVSMDKLQHYWMNADESIEDYAKRIKGTIEDLQKTILEMQQVNADKEAMKPGSLLLKGYSEEEIKQANALLLALQQLFAGLKMFTKGSGGGRTSDPRLQNLKEEISLTKKLYDEYRKLEKQIGATKAAEKIQEIYKNTISTLEGRAKKYGFEFKLPFTDENLKANMQHFIDKMKELQGLKDKKGKPLFPNIGKEIDEAVAQLEDVDLNSLQKALEKKIKDLADRISRTKTAKEFYEKILSQTGDVELATRVSLSIYGSTGEELFEDTVKQIREVFKSGKEDVVIDLEPVFDMTNQRIDYKMLADIYEKYQNDIIDKNRDTAKKIAQEGQKATASNIANWQKELAKAKDFEQQRTDIIRTAAAEREKIIKEVRDPEERERLLNLSREKESQDLSKLNFEEFTKSEDYIKIFENLDNTATSTLKRLRTELQALIDANKDLSPENMKTLVKAMEDIDEQISGRGFGNDMVQSVNDYIASIKNLKTAKQELAKAEAEYEAQEPRLDADIETAKAEKESADEDVVAAQQELLDIQTQMAALREQEIIDETQLAALQAQEVAASNALTAAELKQNQAATAVVNAEQAKAKAADKVKKAEQKVSGEQDKQKKATTKFFKDLQQVAATADQLASVLGDVQEALGLSEDSAAGLVFDSAIQGLQEFSKIMNVIIGLQTLYNIVTSSNPWLAIAAAVLAVGSILGSWISGSKVRKANKEIERQQELLDQLEYTYGRLEKAADKLFGTDYLNNYNQQLKNLQAQQQAYLKQAQAERSKGKKADKDKIKEYENQARETADAIKEMQDDLVAQIVGTDVASAARDFANAWLDAYLSFGSTTDAIKEKFDDMIKNMIVNMVLAQVVKRALEPIFKMIDDLAADGELSADDIAKVMSKVPSTMTQINDGLSVGVKALEAAGVDISKLREGSSEFSGIAKNIAGATSEEINTAAAIGNTIMYHTSHLPIISQNVAAMYQLMSQGKTSAIDSGSAGWTDWQQQAMDNYKAIARNTADTVVECRRAAVACEAATEKLNRALRTKGATSGFNVFLNS